MSISVKKFGEINGKKVELYTLDNSNGLCAKITNYGGIIKSLEFNGIDVVLGRDTLEEYFDNQGYFGALIGRNSNRIENSEFSLNGENYKLYANDGRNNLHGGKEGFDKKVWEAEVVDSSEPALVLKLKSPDGEEGFPGNADIKVVYTLTKENSLKIEYQAVCDEDTVMNLTNHSYFNLNGHNSGGTVDGHKMWLASEFYTPNSEECMPYGEILSSKGTAFDFTNEKTLGESFASSEKQIKMFGGIDHNFVLSGSGFRKVAVLKGDKSGISMEVYTDRPGVQIYSGNVIEQKRVCKENSVYPIHGGICLETQAFPNSMKYSYYPNPVLKKGEIFKTVTEYKFS